MLVLPMIGSLPLNFETIFYIYLALVMLGGVGFVLPIGGGDMPVVISLLNSLSGIAAAFAGLILVNNVLIVAGSLVGASGLILTIIMAKAMNRTIGNILFVGYAASGTSSSSEQGEVKPINAEDAFLILENASSVLIVAGSLVGASGLILTIIMAKAMNRTIGNILFVGYAASGTSSSSEQGEVKPINAEDAFLILENSSSVLIVPGYGMAVAQAQHVVRELGELLEENGTDVKYGIHPVAGRMPGHMNVLLAEANVSYDLLAEPDDVNPMMDTVDVAIVIGANDVVNPSATEEPGSPIYGMPILEVANARTVFVLKRSMSSGFAGVQNPLFFKENTRMLFGDAKESISKLVSEFKE